MVGSSVGVDVVDVSSLEVDSLVVELGVGSMVKVGVPDPDVGKAVASAEVSTSESIITVAAETHVESSSGQMTKQRWLMQ